MLFVDSTQGTGLLLAYCATKSVITLCKL